MGSEIEEEVENLVPEDEEEEEDMDFNPFLKGTPSPEASSSLSSEVEGLVEDIVVETSSGGLLQPGEGNVAENYAVGDSEHGEEVVVCNESEERREGLEDGDDAICKRTRAKYSLASFTLDELETFLQETDDEDDLRNVDDEEEYRKFLAAVLLGGGGGDGDGQEIRGDGNDEEDEDNDADFEIELEELLESDVDDENENRKGSNARGGSRPQTRQNKRKMASVQYEKRLKEQTKRPLRPLLPILPSGGYVPFSAPGGGAFLSMGGVSYSEPSSRADSLINGFTPQQIGQLHCLIYEHVQLLIQIFSLSVVDGSRQHVAAQVKTLISELLEKRDEVIGCRGFPFPDGCFIPSHLCPSVANELPSSAATGQVRRFSWVPSVGAPRSILDVAPLNLVGVFMNDVHSAMSDYRKRQLDFGFDSLNEREPIFCYPNMSSLVATHGEVLQGDAPPSTSQQQPKKTLAATIVENVKKQSIALVPKDISKLAQRFVPLFNPALFPYKPPPAAVVNRILFTDAEDELLARGILEFNNDWKAIQQCFLPCKSKHQIFVRAKNRSSSKAPENPIKTVRRMKNSPLTEEEVHRIQEGLKTFKSDWTSVWRFLVPYRDPSLLPRQWRIALGTQKSYKLDAAKKEKRRLHESNKRIKLAIGTRNQLLSDKDNEAEQMDGGNANGDEYVDVTNGTFVHQAFLADWRPADLVPRLLEQPCTNIGSKGLHGDAQLTVGTQEQQNHFGAREARPIYWIGNTHEVPNPPNFHQYPRATDVTFFRSYPYGLVQPVHQGSTKPSNAAKSQSVHALPRSQLRADGARLVKLAPDLPPVNLPPSVRVIPQSAFRSYTCGQPVKAPVRGIITNDAIKASTVLQPQHSENPNTASSSKLESNKENRGADRTKIASADEHARSPSDQCNDEERGSDAVLEMHPLLFQEPGGGEIPYYRSSSTTGASRYFSFFSSNQPQLSLSLLHNPPQVKHVVHPNKSSRTSISNVESCSIDFHPLLQRPDDENHASMASSSRQNHNGVQDKSAIICGSCSGGLKHSDQCEKANDLDLGIYLRSASVNDKSQGNRNGATLDHSISIVGGTTCGSAMANPEADEICEARRATFCTGRSNDLATPSASVVPCESVSQRNMDDMGDNSHPGIVMEQEELSDSDEEIVENVEFECEEMDDSDGEEGLLCEPLHDQQDKHTPSTVNVPSGSECTDQRLLHPEEKMANPAKDSRSLKLGLISLGNAATTSWLSLESGAPADPLCTTAKQQPGEVEKPPPSRPSRSSKKRTSTRKGVPAQKNMDDMAQQLSLGPLASAATTRKPRTRATRINMSLNSETTAERTPTSEHDKELPIRHAIAADYEQRSSSRLARQLDQMLPGNPLPHPN